MFYKKTSLILLPFTCLIVGSSNCHQASIASISDSKNKPPQRDKPQQHRLVRNKPTFAFASCKGLGSISCMGGAKTDFLIQCKATIADIDTLLEGQFAVIGLLDGLVSPAKAETMVKNAIESKDQVESLLWQDSGDFIYWHKLDKVGTGTKEWMIKVKEDLYKKLTSNQYVIYILYLQKGGSAQDAVIVTRPVQMNTVGQPSLPNYQHIGLEAMPPIEKQTTNGISWFLKGKVTEASIKSDAKMGFVLVRETVNAYNLMQQVIASKDGWPSLTTSFNDEIIIIPGTLRQMNPPIVADLLSSQAPIQGGKFKVLCYLIQNQNYYFSQMTDMPSDVTESSLSQESAPPFITFTGDSHNLKVSNLSICRKQIDDQVQEVTFSDFKIEYTVNDQMKSLPADLQASLLFLHKGTIWRTATIESLFKKLYEANGGLGIGDDGAVCLVADGKRPLDKSAIDFFGRAEHYDYFACLFSTETHKLTFYTQKEEINIEIKKLQRLKEAQPNSIEPSEPLKEAQPNSIEPLKKAKPKPIEPIQITLDNQDAHITLHKPSLSSWWFKDVIYIFPMVTFETSQLDTDQIAHQGFLIANAGDLDSANMDKYSSVVDNFINNDIDKGVSYDSEKEFLIFQQHLTEKSEDLLVEKLYDAYKDKQQGDQILVTSYWVKYNNKVIWSNPVPIKFIIK